MLSAIEIADMRNTLVASLPDRCHIARAANTPDDFGGWVQGFVNISTNVPCRVGPAVSDRGFDVLIGGAPHATAEWNITIPNDIEVLPKDRIIFGTRTFEARQVIDRSWELSLRIFAVEVS